MFDLKILIQNNKFVSLWPYKSWVLKTDKILLTYIFTDQLWSKNMQAMWIKTYQKNVNPYSA